MTHDGSLLSMAGGDSSVEKVIGALVSSIWETYEFDATAPFEARNLHTVILDCEVWRLPVVNLFSLASSFVFIFLFHIFRFEIAHYA